MVIRFVLCFIAILSSCVIFCQDISSVQCFEIDQIDENYIIRLDGIDYKDNDIVFVCEDELPQDIQIRYKENGYAAIGDNWDWTFCNCSNPNASSYFNEISSISFESSNSIIMGVTFDEIQFPSSPVSVNLSLDIRIREKLIFDKELTREQSKYAFDTHPHSAYPHHNPDVPSKFLRHSETDLLITKSPKSFLNNTELSVELNSVLNVDASDQKIDITSITANEIDEAIVNICNDKTIFDVDIYPMITEDIHLYRLSESDDDYANYCVDFIDDDIPYQAGDVKPHLLADCITPIASLPNPATFECINPGMDGSIDLFFELSENGYWYNRKDNDDTGTPDVITFNPILLSTLRIHPGKDEFGVYRCNSRPVTLPMEWDTDIDGDGKLDTKLTKDVPLEIELNKMIESLNEIYNQIGVELNIIDKGYQNLNYNASSFVRNTKPELDYIHYTLIGGNEDVSVKAPITTIYFLDELIVGNKFEEFLGKDSGLPAFAFGKGMTINGEGLNTCFMNSSSYFNPILYRDRTIPHEIGHCKYSLFHPTDIGGVINDDLSSKVTNDKYNFMNGGIFYECCSVHNVNENRVRKYQWKIIRDEN